MKKIDRCLIALLSASLLITSVSGEENKKNMAIDKKYADMTQMVQDWAYTKDVDNLTKVCDIIRNSEDYDDLKSIVQRKIHLLFLLLNVMDESYNPKYETPQINIAPPTHNNIVYNSGISPESIKDPNTRREYEKALAENKIKAEVAAFQLKLGRIRDGWMDYIVEYIKQNYKGEKQINNLIDSNIAKEESRKELKAKFKKNTEKNVNCS